MPRKSKRKRWSLQEVMNLKKYIRTKSELLINNFYENVVEGKMKVRKPPGFFIQMAETLKMKPKQCKSKFQKFEREIYTNYLNLPEGEYQVFLHLRKKNFFNKKFKSNVQNKSRLKQKSTKQDRQNPKKTRRNEQSQVDRPNSETQNKEIRVWNRVELFDLRKSMIEKFKQKRENELKIRESESVNRVFFYFLIQKVQFRQRKRMKNNFGIRKIHFLDPK